MNHKKLAHKTVNAAETVFIKGQEYYRSGKLNGNPCSDDAPNAKNKATGVEQ